MAKSLKTKRKEFEEGSLDTEMVEGLISEMLANGTVWSAGMMYWQLAQKYINCGRMTRTGEILEI